MRKSPFTTFPLSEDAEKHLLNVAESSPSKLLGVRQDKGTNKWRAVIKHQGVDIQLGLFDDKYEAARVRDNKALELYGDNAVTNVALGLTPTQDLYVITGGIEEAIKNINSRLPNHLKYYGKSLFSMIVLVKHDGITLAEAIRKNPELNSISKKDRSKIVLILEDLNLIKIVRQGNMRIDNCKLFLSNCIAQEQDIYTSTSKIQNKETEMNNKELTAKTPEELEAMAKQLLELSQAKKDEIKNGDQIRKTLNPLILAVCQAKGKYNRLLEQQLDVMTELDNAVDALKDALKF
ncbi:hypothetical protein BKK56_04160 [Rodentibacter genomosp. 2]|uniref:hypothetical protein n=1 Tax=Rodentibacter genomosp. 2 TaxID=1908266 RepID=UPI00098492D6|nr:hypothetical protein BKK56_04160 [Rodentibacter genomosp. 2]